MAVSTLSETEAHVIEERLNWGEPCDRGEEYSGGCWFKDYPLLDVAERIKWESKGLLTGGCVWGCRCVADRSVLWSTDKGTVQKVIVLPSDDLQTEELVLEEVEVFKVSLSLCYIFVFYLFCPCFLASPHPCKYLVHSLLFSILLMPLYIIFSSAIEITHCADTKLFSLLSSLLQSQQWRSHPKG